jgi:hypothetical protein
MIKQSSLGKVPLCKVKDGQSVPVYITVNNKKIVAVTDGKGNAFKVKGADYYEKINSKCIKENIYSPNEYEFERFFSGFDY